MRENLLISLRFSYHHTFPFDYRIAEIGFQAFNPAKWFIDACFKLGLASDLKVASPQLIQKTKAKVESSRQQETQFYLHDHPYVDPHAYCLEDGPSQEEDGRGL